MAVDTTISSAFNSLGTTGENVGEDKSILNKDDFLKLLLVQLQNQDPTNPQDTDKILQQTSELATLEASTNTNKALENLSSSLTSSAQYSTLTSIGKMADTGLTEVTLESGTPIDFPIYFPEDVDSGEIRIFNDQGILIDSLALNPTTKGTSTFTWDGKNKSGVPYADGDYRIEASYQTPSGENRSAQYGIYPIEAVRFDGSEAEFRIGDTYIPMSSVREIYNP
jgi:flagellar basal-body rod modification protein FlgD